MSAYLSRDRLAVLPRKSKMLIADPRRAERVAVAIWAHAPPSDDRDINRHIFRSSTFYLSYFLSDTSRTVGEPLERILARHRSPQPVFG